jgi:hypothetical protein
LVIFFYKNRTEPNRKWSPLMPLGFKRHGEKAILATRISHTWHQKVISIFHMPTTFSFK